MNKRIKKEFLEALEQHCSFLNAWWNYERHIETLKKQGVEIDAC